jgi:hypothetical protein
VQHDGPGWGGLPFHRSVCVPPHPTTSAGSCLDSTPQQKPRSSATATLVSSSTPFPSPLRVLCGIWHCTYQWFWVSPLVIWGPGILVNIIHDDGLWMASSYCYWILFLLEWNDYSMVAAKQTMSVCLPIVYFYPSMFTAVMRRLLTNGSLGQSTHLTASKLFQESC